MRYIDVTANLAEVDFSPMTLEKEVIQNVKMILSTPIYSVPLDRAFGTILDAVDAPMPVAKAKISANIVQAIQKFEPRAKVTNVSFSGDEISGIMRPKVRIELV